MLETQPEMSTFRIGLFGLDKVGPAVQFEPGGTALAFRAFSA